MKKKLIAVLAAALVITGIPAVNGTVAYAKPKTKEYVEVPPTGIDYNGADFNNISYYTEAGGYHIKLQEGATYYIQGQLRLNSNTYLQVFDRLQGLKEGAPIHENYGTHTGELLKAPHFSWSSSHLLMLYDDYGK